MKLSTRTTYGLKALSALAKNPGRMISLAEIADQEGISTKYLEAIFARLKKARIIKSDRGTKGGYGLARDPQRITMSEVFHSLEGARAVATCKSNDEIKQCTKACHCSVNKVSESLNNAIDQALRQMTLKDLIK
jgi:Rrf2 family protein